MKYAGIGSRKTPKTILLAFTEIARRLERHSFLLRSGGAEGADSAFEAGVQSLKEIYLANDSTVEAEKIAESVHPAWHNCSSYAKKLHGRNVFQILGREMNDPVDFVICYTENGLVKGGTATAIKIAINHKIPVFNFGNKQDIRKLFAFLKDKFNIIL
jgi:hypothetical protein